MIETLTELEMDITPQPSGVEARAKNAAERIGNAAEEIERLPFDLSVLENDGIFCNVDASGFGLLDRRLDWQSLGISLPRGSGVSFRPPRSCVPPPRPTPRSTATPITSR